MSDMTWKQFKAHIDKQLSEQGINEDTPIWYIDVSFPCMPSEDNQRNYKVPIISIDEDSGMAIDD